MVAPTGLCITERDPTEHILGRLEGLVSRGDDQWDARCPAHADHLPSLSVGRAPDGSTLLHCHAGRHPGCSTETVLNALSLAPRDLFPKTAGAPKTARRLRQHVYEDVNRQPRYRVVRWERTSRSKFSFEHQDETGEWVRGRGSEPCLYRLPDLIDHPATEPVWCVEGERDADTAWDLGVAATTAPSGAWAKVDLSVLSGRTAVVICDTDDSGLKLGVRRAAVLRNAGVHVDDEDLLVPRVATPGKDLTDLVQQVRHDDPSIERPDLLLEVLSDLRTAIPRSKRSLQQRVSERYAVVPERVTRLGSPTARVFALLDMLALDSGLALVSATAIADYCGMSRNTVADALNELEAANLVHPAGRGKFHVLNPARSRRN